MKNNNININNTKAGVIFNIIITVLAIGVIASAIEGWNEITRAPFYLVLGIVILSTRIWKFHKAKRHK